MVAVCFYFQVHQPFRLRHFSVFDVGQNHNYFDDQKNREVMKKVAEKCYLPTNQLLLKLITRYKNTDRPFKVSFSITGTAIEQFELYAPAVLESFKRLAETGHVEFLSETYYHSLSVLYSKEEFKHQVELHKKLIKKHFNQTPKIFRNTELIFSNEIGKLVEEMGYKGIIAEGADHILDWRSPNFVYQPVTCDSIKLLLKNYKLSDDIAFRFSNKGWESYPLTTPKFTEWVNAANGNGDIINLFMDYETFGEHQWEDTGIFKFLEHLPEEFLKHPDASFITCSEAIKYPVRDKLDFHLPVSWADLERDLSAWRGNKIQDSALHEVYAIEQEVKNTQNEKLIEDWRRLTTSDHFYYMCTKWFSDGDVHKYFNPYENPYDAFIIFMNVLQDIELRIKEEIKKIEVSTNSKIFKAQISK